MGTSLPEIDQEDFLTDINKVRRSNLLYNRKEFAWYEKFNRFGCLDPYNRLQTTREYTFFSKPDLHLFDVYTNNLQPAFANDPFFIDMVNRYPYVCHQLQSSSRSGITSIDTSPFMTILTNGLTNTLDVDNISAGEMDNASNMWGTSISYRKDGWSSDENFDFSLEFEDTKFAEIYHMAKIYEEYHRSFVDGDIYPPNIDGVKELSNGANFNRYMKYKELHDTFALWRFVVDEDLESIIYWAYVCGAYFNNVPREAFNDISNSTGLKMTLDFKSFCVEDNNPMSLIHFNKLINDSYYGGFAPTSIVDNIIPIYDESIDGIDGSWATHPYIIRVKADSSWYASKGMKYKYKLIWIR